MILFTFWQKKKNKFRVRQETSDKNAIQKSSRKKLKRKAQVHVIHCLGKKRPKNPRKNPPDRKIRFMFERAEETRKQRAEQHDEVVYLATLPEHARDQKFKQNEIKWFNASNNITVFSAKTRGGKALAAEQKIK